MKQYAKQSRHPYAWAMGGGMGRNIAQHQTGNLTFHLPADVGGGSYHRGTPTSSIFGDPPFVETSTTPHHKWCARDSWSRFACILAHRAHSCASPNYGPPQECCWLAAGSSSKQMMRVLSENKAWISKSVFHAAASSDKKRFVSFDVGLKYLTLNVDLALINIHQQESFTTSTSHQQLAGKSSRLAIWGSPAFPIAHGAHGCASPRSSSHELGSSGKYSGKPNNNYRQNHHKWVA